MRNKKHSEFVSAKLRSGNPVKIEGKECDTCHLYKSVEEFSRRDTNLDGRLNTCKGCLSDQRKIKYLKEKADKKKFADFLPI